MDATSHAHRAYKARVRCQNYEISKSPPIGGKYYSPEDLVNLAAKWHCHGLSYSFNEPTLLVEHAIKAHKIAKKHGLYTTYVTNGYMTLECLEALINSGLDAMNVDIKGDEETVRKYCGADVSKIWRNCRHAKEHGVHIEITTLVVTGVNDNLDQLKGISQKIMDELGEETPWHITRYFPAFKFLKPPPPIKLLEKAREQAIKIGLKYVYLGNIPGHPWENTYCPNCQTLLIERSIFSITRYLVTPDNKCPNCGLKIPIIGRYCS